MNKIQCFLAGLRNTHKKPIDDKADDKSNQQSTNKTTQNFPAENQGVSYKNLITRIFDIRIQTAIKTLNINSMKNMIKNTLHVT